MGGTLEAKVPSGLSGPWRAVLQPPLAALSQKLDIPAK
jgi:hypothetical protein